MRKKALVILLAFVLGTIAPPSVWAAKSPDVSGDGRVDAADVRLVLQGWLTTLGNSLDIDENGKVNSHDLAFVIRDFGLVFATPTPSPAVTSEWTQHGHDAQRTSYTDQVVATPWRWKWSWNGPNASGGISTGKFGLPRNSQPVTGGGRVYVAAGSRGVYVLNNVNGAVVCTFPGTFNSTPAYTNESVFALATNSTLYKFNAGNCSQQGTFATGGSSTLPLPPAISGSRVFVVGGSNVYAVDADSMTQIWSYAAGSAVHTPAAYSPSRNSVLVVTQDLYVHAINNTNGARIWRMKPTVRNGGNPTTTSLAESQYGWPVVADVHGYVLVKYRLDWNAIWDYPSSGGQWPTDNASMRSYLQSNPEYQALFVLDLDDGTVPFIANVGHGGFGDGDYLPMGPQPVVKRLSSGQEVAYVIMRGSPCVATPCDGRWDSHYGELLLDNTTISGWEAGYVRFIQSQFFPTDEQPFLSMATNQLFAGHWLIGLSSLITDRSSARGTSGNQIVTSALRNVAIVSCGRNYGASHFANEANVNTEGGGCPRWFAGPGFYIYYTDSRPYDTYWSEYAGWTISNGMMLFVATDGSVSVLEGGNP